MFIKMSQCVCCNQSITGKPWMSVDLNPTQPTHLCRYLCYRDYQTQLPSGWWSSLINREDFNQIRPIPHIATKQTFRLLSHDELLQLSETEQDAYYESLQSTIDLNPMLTEVYEQQESEDRRTQMLEEDWESGSQSSYSEDV